MTLQSSYTALCDYIGTKMMCIKNTIRVGKSICNHSYFDFTVLQCLLQRQLHYILIKMFYVIKMVYIFFTTNHIIKWSYLLIFSVQLYSIICTSVGVIWKHLGYRGRVIFIWKINIICILLATTIDFKTL